MARIWGQSDIPSSMGGGLRMDDRKKPCPFCGSVRIGVEEDRTGVWCALCWDFGAGFGHTFSSEREAVTAWNERKGAGESGALAEEF